MVQISSYKERFPASLPASQRANADFNRTVFTAVAFYFCAKRHKLKVDKLKLIELGGTSEAEFATVSNSMLDLCFDAFGTSKEKKDSSVVKGHRELLDVIPSKRDREDDMSDSDGSVNDEHDELQLSSYKRKKLMDKKEYEEWKSTFISSKNGTKPAKKVKQAKYNFVKKTPSTVSMQAS